MRLRMTTCRQNPLRKQNALCSKLSACEVGRVVCQSADQIQCSYASLLSATLCFAALIQHSPAYGKHPTMGDIDWVMAPVVRFFILMRSCTVYVSSTASVGCQCSSEVAHSQMELCQEVLPFLSELRARNSPLCLIECLYVRKTHPAAMCSLLDIDSTPSCMHLIFALVRVLVSVPHSLRASNHASLSLFATHE